MGKNDVEKSETGWEKTTLILVDRIIWYVSLVKHKTSQQTLRLSFRYHPPPIQNASPWGAWVPSVPSPSPQRPQPPPLATGLYLGVASFSEGEELGSDVVGVEMAGELLHETLPLGLHLLHLRQQSPHRLRLRLRVRGCKSSPACQKMFVPWEPPCSSLPFSWGAKGVARIWLPREEAVHIKKS